jgi:cellulose synthase/poly-beta-1,6-N-acetylglucosamine synthase-like glycosyltransferase
MNNRSQVSVYFLKSLFNLYSHTKKIYGCQIQFFSAAEVNRMRNTACNFALENNFDYIFQLDADMTYPADSIINLMKRKKDVIIGLYRMRYPPFLPVAYKEIPENINELIKESNRQFSNRLQRIEACGGGGLLIETKILKKLNYPFFFEQYDGKDCYSGDIYFGMNLKIHGVKLWLDPKVQYGHELNTEIKGSGQMNFL